MDGRFVADGVPAAVAAAQAAAGERNVGLLGAAIARQAVEAGLLDEVMVEVAPVLLGDGVRLFERAGGAPVRLTPVEVVESPPLTRLRFSIA
jgi:dihydrofolate reductase